MTKTRVQPYVKGAPSAKFLPAAIQSNSTPSTNSLLQFDTCQNFYDKVTGNIYIWTPLNKWQIISTSSAGILPVSKGGTGVGTLTGIPLASGTNAFTALTYVAPASWTPTLAGGGSSTGLTYSAHTGYYCQIGPVVFFNASITVSSWGSLSGTVTLTNMPVAFGPQGLSNSIIVPGWAGIDLTADYTSIMMYGSTSTAVMNFYIIGSDQSTSALTVAQFGTNTIFLSGFYLTN